MNKWVKRIVVTTAVLVVVAIGVGVALLHTVDFSVPPEEIDRRFAAQNITPHIGAVTFQDREVHFVEVGNREKPLVLFVHGSPGTWDNFLGFMTRAELLDRFCLLSVDRPGFGKTGGPHEPSVAQQAAVLAQVLREQHPGRRAIVVGHSYGGPVIARLAMDHPEQVQALVMVAGSVDPALEKTKWFQIPADWLLLSWMIPQSLVSSNREILALKDELEAMMPLWSRITHPVTVIQGEEDVLVPAANADFAERMLTRAPVTMVRVPGMNHFVPWSHPDLIVEALMAFVSTETGEDLS